MPLKCTFKSPNYLLSQKPKQKRINWPNFIRFYDALDFFLFSHTFIAGILYFIIIYKISENKKININNNINNNININIEIIDSGI